jgi:hypothetical protein
MSPEQKFTQNRKGHKRTNTTLSKKMLGGLQEIKDAASKALV